MGDTVVVHGDDEPKVDTPPEIAAAPVESVIDQAKDIGEHGARLDAHDAAIETTNAALEDIRGIAQGASEGIGQLREDLVATENRLFAKFDEVAKPVENILPVEEPKPKENEAEKKGGWLDFLNFH